MVKFVGKVMKHVRFLFFFNIFTNLNWTVRILPVIFYALFSVLLADDIKADGKSLKNSKAEIGGGIRDDAVNLAELEAAGRETEMLRKELADVLLKSEEIFNSHRRLQLSIASTVANSEKRNVEEGELKSLESFANVRQEMKVLASKTVELSQFIGTALEKKELAETDKIRIKFKLDDLKATAERINALIASPESKEKADKCRILSINEKLQTVILDAGTANGVNTGLIWRVTTRSGRLARLKVIAARPFICAAMVLEGEFSSLAPGMPVSIGDN
jgi:hypothetical protein